MRGRVALIWLLVVTIVVPAIMPRAVAAQGTDLDAAKTAAWQLSVFESESQWDALYDHMHPDAQLTVGRDTVTYWYRTYFAPNGPNPATVTGAKLVDWTWPVTGRTYPATAEVSFTQVFGTGQTVNDVVRLVRATDGSWRWFFGRSLEFVHQMAGEAWSGDGARSIVERAGVPAPALFAEAIAAIDRVPPACFAAAGIRAVPGSLGTVPVSLHQSESGVRTESASYLQPGGSGFPDLMANVRRLDDPESPESIVQRLQESQVNWQGPPYSSPPRGLVVDLAPASPYLIVFYEEYSEALGFVPVLTWGARGSNTVFGIAGPQSGWMNALVSGWSQNARASCAG